MDDGRLWGGGTEQKGKRFKDMDNSVAIVNRGVIRGLNGSGKNIIKKKNMRN